VVHATRWSRPASFAPLLSKVQTPRFLGGLSCFRAISEPCLEGFNDGLVTDYGQPPGHGAPACPGHLPTFCTRESSTSGSPAASPGQAAQGTVHPIT